LFTKFDDKVHIIILHQSHGSEAINCIMGIWDFVKVDVPLKLMISFFLV
jgi:hypothetical protein